MDRGGSTDELFNIIRKELNIIIEHGEKNSNVLPSTSRAHTSKSSTKSVKSQSSSSSENVEEKNVTLPKISAESKKENKKTARLAAGGREDANNGNPTVDRSESGLSALHQKFKSTLEEDIATQAALLDSPRAKSIDADVQRMQMELQDSYNVFQTISEKFETIDFSRLQKRIKDLNLNSKRDILGKTRTDELKMAVDEGFNTNRLHELTAQVGEKFRNHPGEFANIPELSAFFQACTQLEHVLGNLKRQRSDVLELEERMRRAAEISYNRVNNIKQQLSEQDFEDNEPSEEAPDLYSAYKK